MAQFGAKRPIFAPTKTTPDNALPTYDYEHVVTVGKLVKADLTVTNASGELYADDALAEKVDMFASGSLALETDDKTDEVHAAIHGATKDTQSSEVTDSDGDVALAVAFAITRSLSATEYAISRACFIRSSRLFSATTARRRKAPLSRSARARRPLPCSVAIPAHGASRKSLPRRASVSRGAIPSSARARANIYTRREASENGSPPALVIGG